MRDDQTFEMLLESVLHERANPEPTDELTHKLVSLTLDGAASATMDGAVYGVGFTGELAAESTLSSLWNGLRDLLFPKRLPPITLTSRPVPVSDRMAGDREYASTAYAVAAHAMGVFLIGFVVRAQIRTVDEVKTPVPMVAPVLRDNSKGIRTERRRRGPAGRCTCQQGTVAEAGGAADCAAIEASAVTAKDRDRPDGGDAADDDGR